METDPASEPDMRNIIYDLVRKNPTIKELQFVCTDKETFRVERINVGYVNYVVRVSSADGKQTFIAKHYEETARANKEFQVPRERALMEYNALRWFHKVHPGGSPTPYAFDAEGFTVAMVDMGDMDTLHIPLKQGDVDTNTMLAISAYVADVHNSTSRQRITKERWGELEEEFREVGMAATMSTIIFDNLRGGDDSWASLDEKTLQVVRSSADTPVAVQRISDLEKAYKENRDCLVHRDLHFLAILLKGTQFAIHDMEFVGLGPRWSDIGPFLSGFVIASHHHREQNHLGATSQMQDIFVSVIEKYLEVAALSPSEKDAFMTDLWYFTAVWVLRLITFGSIDALLLLTPQLKAKVMKTCLDQLNEDPRVMSAQELSDVFFTAYDAGVDG